VIDWSALRQYGPQTIECRCGKVYRSLFKLQMVSEGQKDELVGFTETPCPSCDSTRGHVRRATSDPETWTIGGGEP
jgi:hypothetical protein